MWFKRRGDYDSLGENEKLCPTYEDSVSEDNGQRPVSEFPQRRRRIRGFWIHVSLLTCNLLVLVSAIALAVSSRRQPDISGGIVPLATKPVPFEFNTSEYYKFKYFSYHRNDDIDTEWNKLLGPQNLWLTEDDALKAGHTGRNIMDRPVVLPNGTYFGTLWVYHELHCINKLYHALFPDLYPQNLTKFQKGMQLEHNVHCLDFLRQEAMCRPNTTPMFYVWRNKMRKPTFDGGEQHQCVNWDELETWVDSRGFDPFTPGLLMHPTLGNPYGPGDDSPHLEDDVDII